MVHKELMTTPYHRVTSSSAGWVLSVLLLGPCRKSNKGWHSLTLLPRPSAFSPLTVSKCHFCFMDAHRLPDPALPAGRRTACMYLINTLAPLPPQQEQLWPVITWSLGPTAKCSQSPPMELDLKLHPSLIFFPSLTYFPTIRGFPGIIS